MTRVRQSEWRRRWGIAGVVEFDGQVQADAEDGRTYDTEQFTTINSFIGSLSHRSFFWIDNITIPAGATVTAAYITVESSSADNGTPQTDIFMCDEDDPAAPTTWQEHTDDPRTTAVTTWDSIVMVPNTPINSPDMTGPVQEVLDRPGWNSGQAMMVLWDVGGGDAGDYVGGIDQAVGGQTALKLHVEYSA